MTTRRAILVGILVTILLVGSAAPILLGLPPPVGSGDTPHGRSANLGSPLLVGRTDSGPGLPLGPATLKDSNVTFSETGLPSGTSWEVIVSPNGSSFATDNDTNRSKFSETLPDGDYNISAEASVADYATYGAPSSVDLTGSTVSVSLPFYRGYHLTFSAEGLPYNETWNISLTADGLTQNRTVAGTSTDFWLPVGDYSYSDSAAGYVTGLGSGVGQISANSSITFDFSREKLVPGVLRVLLDVPSADVYLNGDLNSGVPKGATAFNLTPGIWSVFIHAPGYGDYFNVTTIRSNQTVTMVVDLAPNPGNPGPALLSGTAELIIAVLVGGIAVIAIVLTISWRRLSRG